MFFLLGELNETARLVCSRGERHNTVGEGLVPPENERLMCARRGDSRIARDVFAPHNAATHHGIKFHLVGVIHIRLFATVPNVEPPFGGRTKVRNLAPKTSPVKVLGGVGTLTYRL